MAKRGDPFEGGIKAKKQIPFDFVLDELEALAPTTRPMFGCTAVYVEDRIVCILRDKGPSDRDSGVWLAYQPEHEAALLALYPPLVRISIFGDKVQGWRVLPARHPEFEDHVLDVCKRVRARDMRFGKVPGTKKKSAKAGAKKAPVKNALPKKAAPKKAPVKKAPTKAVRPKRAQRPK